MPWFPNEFEVALMHNRSGALTLEPSFLSLLPLQFVTQVHVVSEIVLDPLSTRLDLKLQEHVGRSCTYQ